MMENKAIFNDILEIYMKFENYLWDPLWFIPREKALAMRTPELFRNSRNFDQRSSLLF